MNNNPVQSLKPDFVPEAAPPKKRVVIVSNRLPFTIREESGQLRYVRSVGGLATGLSSYLEFLREHPAENQDHQYLWVGWPGSTISKEKHGEFRSACLREKNALPVFLSEQDIEKFYQGFCNKTIWPLFHYFPAFTNYDEGQWKHYIEVNRSFCQTLLELLSPDDTLWIHDYHFMLLPGMIREALPEIAIGFFLHIPFPNYEIYRLLPRAWRKEILEGLLGADLIGFHTNDYKQDFLRCVLRILGYSADLGEIIVDNRAVKAQAFPMGIDFEKYRSGAVDAGVLKENSRFRVRLGNIKVILSIDRLDYTKGIANRLEAFQTFLESYPQWHGKVVLLLIVVPSRVDVDNYEMMKNQIDCLVGKINGSFGSLGWSPIIYLFRSLTFSPLVTMYASSHIALITPLRDGMNLIAKEYLAARVNKTGVLILSEMAGAANDLSESIIINPNNRNEIAVAIKDALEMPGEEQIRRNTIMQERLKRYDVVHWAGDFMCELRNARSVSQKYFVKMLGHNARRRLLEEYRESSSRLIFLDYDGTLVPFSLVPKFAIPGKALLRTLKNLAGNSRNKVVIASGRDRYFLDQWFSDIGVSLIAEHGAWIKERGAEWQLMVSSVQEWKPKLKPLLEKYVDRVAGTFIEEKEFALVWHHRGADLEPGRLVARELKDHLLALTANINVHILQGNKTVEVRVAGISKGSSGQEFLSRGTYDFIACMGDDTTDEDLFSVLPESAFSIRVGLSGTCARYTVSGVHDVTELLQEMARG